MLFRKNKKIKPRVAITHSDKQPFIQLFSIRCAVFFAGGIPISVSPDKAVKPGEFDALIIYGGVDICPKRYGNAPKSNYQYDDARDLMEFEFLDYAYKNELPVLGICRGAQLINVFHGGDLHLDVVKAYEKAKYPSTLLGYIFFRKKIKIEKGSLLNKITHQEVVKVNSIHKQSINKLGKTLEVTAIEENGVVQSVENKLKAFYMGVQFHPEFMIHRKKFRNIFNTLILSVKTQ